MTKQYQINEIFYSLQGEGMRAGTANIFIRFSGCNLKCEKGVTSELSPGNFDCDTEFVSGLSQSVDEIIFNLKQIAPQCSQVILTGGEPGLQVDEQLICDLKNLGYYLAIETNGSIELPIGLDWITVSPKIAEHCIKQKIANEVKYVRGFGQGLPKTVVKSENLLISPAFDGSNIDPKTLDWCIKLVKENPKWRLSCQLHKMWKVR